MDFRGINPLPDKSAQKKEKQKVRHFPPLNSSHGQETSSVLPDALDKKRKSLASPETEVRRTRARTRAIGEDGKPVPNALDNKGKSPASPKAEQRRARAIGKDGKPVPRELKRSSASTRDNPGLRRVMRGLSKLKLWGGETRQGNDGDKRIGQKFGNYRIVKLLGKGGFANVYLGKRIDSKELAAVKLLQKHLVDPKELEEFRREAGILTSLNHPNIVRVLEFGTKREVPFLVMEYAPHGTLRHAHLEDTRLSLTQVVKYVNQIADALDYVHREKKMHLDIKPDNLFLGKNPDGEKKVLLGDFGLVQIVHNTASRIIPEKVAGTVPYMDPEYMLGKPPCPASDQYALGVMVYEWLSGELPFQGDHVRVVGQHLSGIRPKPLYEKVPGISPEIDEVVSRALKTDPKDRYPSVKEFALKFEEACREWEQTMREEQNASNRVWNNDQSNEVEELLKALTIRKQEFGPDDLKTVDALNNLANLYREQGKYAEAKPLYESCFKICKKKLGLYHRDTAMALNNLANLYHEQGEYAEAEHRYNCSLEICKKKLEPDRPETARVMNNLANLYLEQGEYVKAEPLYTESLRICEGKLGSYHLERAKAMNGLANLYREQGEYVKAEPLYTESLKICEGKLGEKHPETAKVMKDLAGVYCKQGWYAEAERLYNHSLTICVQELGEKHPETAKVLNGLANLYCEQSKYAKAEHWYKDSFEIFKEKLEPDHLDTAKVMNNLANLYRKQGRYAEAEPLYESALEIYEKKFKSDHSKIVSCREKLEKCRKRQRVEQSQRNVPTTSSSVSLSKEASSKNVLEELKEGVEKIMQKKLEMRFNNCLEKLVKSSLSEINKEAARKQFIDNFERKRGLPEKEEYVAGLEEYIKILGEET